MVNYQDRATCPIFGDGAAACMVEATTEDYGIMAVSYTHLDDVKSARPLRPGLHTCYNGGTEGRYHASGCQSLKPLSVRTGVGNPTPRSWIR